MTVAASAGTQRAVKEAAGAALPALPVLPVQLVEMFSSVQGEGPELGARTLFVRFAECDLRCAWCDTPHSWSSRAECALGAHTGRGGF